MFVRKMALALSLIAALPLAARAGSTLPPDLEASLRTKFEAFSAQNGALFERLDTNDVRHPYEKKVVDALLKIQDVKDLLPEAQRQARELNNTYHKKHLLTGVLCSETQFPEIYKLAKENAVALHMKDGFKVYVMNSASINAYTWSFEQDNYGIAIYSGLIRSMTIEQLRAILGHEMGHVKGKHILWSVLLQLYQKKFNKLPAVFTATADGSTDASAPKNKTILPAAFGLNDLPADLQGDFNHALGLTNVPPMQATDVEAANVSRYQQANEYTGDRAGAIASGDRTNTLMGMVKLASGNSGDLGGFDMDAYLKQIETVLATLSHADLQEMMANEGTHAFTLMRVGELDLFFKSDDYNKALEERSTSIFRDMMSAEYQISGTLLDTIEAQKKFFTGPGASELNALERRLKEKEFNDIIQPRQTAVDALQPMIFDTIAEIGLGRANGAFDIYEAYARMRKTGVAIKPLSEKLIERIKFELTNAQLPGDQHDELTRKLKVATEIKDLKTAKPASDDAK